MEVDILSEVCNVYVSMGVCVMSSVGETLVAWYIMENSIESFLQLLNITMHAKVSIASLICVFIELQCIYVGTVNTYI